MSWRGLHRRFLKETRTSPEGGSPGSGRCPRGCPKPSLSTAAEQPERPTGTCPCMPPDREKPKHSAMLVSNMHTRRPTTCSIAMHRCI
jgi:hypothetical protein